MAAEGFWVMETGITEVEEAGSGPERPTRPSMVVPQAGGVHAEGAIVARRPAFPQGVGDVSEQASAMSANT
jgi:hypothetical protein